MNKTNKEQNREYGYCLQWRLSTNNQTLPLSGDETDKFTAYSAAVHKVVVMVNAGILGLLQLMNQQNSCVFETHRPELLCLCVLFLFYAVLRVREAIHVRLGPGIVLRLVGHTSHMFGGLAALVLVHVVCATFALVLLFLWVLWLFTVVYYIFKEFVVYYPEENKSGAGLPEFPPV